MDRTQRATGDYVPQSSNRGQHGQRQDTSVRQHMNPTVTHETVKPTRHEEITKPVEKEIHQDHYRQKVQPIHDREVVPEKHHHNQAAVVNREFDQRDNQATERALRNEAARFRDERDVTDTKKTQSQAPGAQREHVHHHVHENVQPVLEREVVQPEVVHTTVPIHEVHHEQARHHGTTTLPSVSLDEFKRNQAGGSLGGSHHNSTEHRSNVGNVGNVGSATNERGGAGVQRNPAANNSMIDQTAAATGANREGTTTGAHRGVGSAGGPAGVRRASSSSSSDNEIRSTQSKGSFMDKLNPMKDADGDGKKGFMS